LIKKMHTKKKNYAIFYVCRIIKIILRQQPHSFNIQTAITIRPVSVLLSKSDCYILYINFAILAIKEKVIVYKKELQYLEMTSDQVDCGHWSFGQGL